MKYVLIALAGIGSLLAADAPKTLSPDFSKAGLKALIAVRNGLHYGSSLIDNARVQAAMDDAELAAATDNDKAALAVVDAYRVRCLRDAITFDTRKINARIALREAGEVNDDIIDTKALLQTSTSPETLKINAGTKACSDGIEKMLRASRLTSVAECDEPKEEAKK